MEHQQIKEIYRDYVICWDPLANPFGIPVAVWALLADVMMRLMRFVQHPRTKLDW